MMSLSFGLFTQVSDSEPQGPLVGIVFGREKLLLISKEIRYLHLQSSDSWRDSYCYKQARRCDMNQYITVCTC